MFSRVNPNKWRQSRTYPIELVLRVFLKGLLWEDTEITDIPVAFVLAVEQHLALR